MSPTAAVVPLKSFDRAKSRLGDAEQRPGLAAAMAADVLAALGAVRRVDEILVVSRERPPQAGVTWIRDEREAGHSAAALLGVDAAVARGAQRVLMVPGDCPAMEPDEVDELLEHSTPAPEPEVVVVSDRHGPGTNALVLSPPDVIRPSFGLGSFARHAAFARSAGAALRVASPPSLLLDVDTPEDLEALQAALRPGAAPLTRALLPLTR